MTSGENTRAATKGYSSKLQGDLNFAFDQRQSEVNLHKATGQWFSPGTLVSSTNKTDCQDITEILLKVALNTMNQ